MSATPRPDGSSETLRSGALEGFRSLSHKVAEAVGSPGAFITGLAITIVWAAVGPLFHYSNTWQLVINTGTTIITFLMVFLIQSTQNRDARVVHLKLDELLRALKDARNSLVHLEDLSDEQLERLEKEFSSLRRRSPASDDPAGDRAKKGGPPSIELAGDRPQTCT
jgi:low affinity Fe/Cu permease